MQINGIGNHQGDMHHVTTCIHGTHKHLDSKMKGASADASNSDRTPTISVTPDQTGESFSLSAWLQNALSGARRLLGRIWGGSAASLSGEAAGDKMAAGTEALHTSQIEVTSAAVQPAKNFNNNPYFTMVPESVDVRQNVWQKIKVRFQNMAGFLTKRFSFSNNNSFQTRQQRPKEDLRRHSRYRKDDVEIDCILTDDSYLMDSYNEKGEYSKLSVKGGSVK